ncbi:MAG: hypothetical protein ACLQFR_08425 [Streptosporangiaceae bacterium]
MATAASQRERAVDMQFLPLARFAGHGSPASALPDSAALRELGDFG